MTSYEGPILDNHLHLDPVRGDGLEAVKKFKRSGGTHICLVNKPSWTLDINVTEGSDYRGVFDITIDIAEEARNILEGDVYPVLGVHPAVVSRLVQQQSVNEAIELMEDGLDVAAEYVEGGKAVALKSGRPHYDVSTKVWEASNRVMQHAFRLAASLDCAVQLHTESNNDFSDVAKLANEAGMDTERVVKHYASPEVSSVVPSVLSREDWIKDSLHKSRFMMETDYLDDPDRPGAVLGARTVPKRVKKFSDQKEAMHKAHVETPKQVYDVEIEL